MATQPFPHRLFTVAEMTLTLVDLGLSPGGSLVVKKRDLNLPSATSGETGISIFLILCNCHESISLFTRLSATAD